MKVNYIRVSTEQQNISRQLKEGFDKTFIDKCSGVISFKDRLGGKKLIDFLKKNEGTTVEVKSVDRLGRNTLDILNTIELFKECNSILKVDDLGMDSNSPFFDVMVSLMSTIAQHDKNMINERTKEGREIAKIKGVYKGRKKGSIIDREKYLVKYADIVKLLNKDVSITDISNITGKTRQTIYKVKKMI